MVFFAGAAPALACSAASRTSACHEQGHGFRFQFFGLDGATIRLADYAGKPILIVNTASQCGFTPQFTGLQQLWTQFHDRGLMIVGVPSNDFGGQEPGGASEIAATAHDHYGVKFPIAAKARGQGRQRPPVLQMGRRRTAARNAKWNFHKYLIGDDGRIAAVFATDVEPTDTRVVTAIAKELTAS